MFTERILPKSLRKPLFDKLIAWHMDIRELLKFHFHCFFFFCVYFFAYFPTLDVISQQNTWLGTMIKWTAQYTRKKNKQTLELIECSIHLTVIIFSQRCVKKKRETKKNPSMGDCGLLSIFTTNESVCSFNV